MHGAVSTFRWHSLRSPGEDLLAHPTRRGPMSNPSKALAFTPTPLPTPLSGRICSSSQQSQCFVHTSITALGVVAESVLQPWTPSGRDQVSWPFFLSLRAEVCTTGGAQGLSELRKARVNPLTHRKAPCLTVPTLWAPANPHHPLSIFPSSSGKQTSNPNWLHCV